jgi:copper chaperone CopZ
MNTMKTLTLLAALFLVVAAPTFAQKASPAAKVPGMECENGKPGKKKVVGTRDSCAVPLTLALSGLHCAGCEQAVTSGLLGVKGVEEAKVSAKTQSAVVWVCPDKNVTSEALKAAVAKAGYKAVKVEKGAVRRP